VRKGWREEILCILSRRGYQVGWTVNDCIPNHIAKMMIMALNKGHQGIENIDHGPYVQVERARLSESLMLRGL